MQESSYNVGVLLRSPSSPSRIGQSEMCYCCDFDLVVESAWCFCNVGVLG
uniref:Uncharacterized protein n=1 Tax=Fagus sylvatica TaxID=28930 RepID=A0A2N9G6C5_FAGSY